MELDPVQMEARVSAFKNDLRIMSSVDIIRRHVIHGACYVLTDHAYYDLRSKVAAQYNLHPNDVYVVGSGKLGFSIAPKKRYRHFADESDIDVVVVSSTLFDVFWKKVHYYAEHGGYWEQCVQFKRYHFNGWIRPDLLPPEKSFEEALRWWTFFNGLSQSGLYSSFRVRGAIYRELYFLESYQLRSVSQCKDQLEEPIT